ncbi:Octanoyltransferase LipM [Novipirellula galeiformis]|uniref:Octanoyltransferase LipM n=1 Tax=Novipirellula galeiformis TaxID=2528004 RepID=A0A5C6CT34_9BACT|nr:biotin/lipoate A/B protein ligase family protein [Novipirellula galeiformis]TWU26581.1 Octanoyltransferase LipM [Novipirellula galeiformis]
MQARLIELAAGGPAENMAIDQALLESVHCNAVPTLRLYTWSEPTVSLGYFQKATDRRTHLPSSTSAFVRRATGGGAIVHHHELTYSFVWPLQYASMGAKAGLYQQTHQAIVESLRSFGVQATRFGDGGNASVAGTCDSATQTPGASSGDPFLCFQRRTEEDLIVSGYKVVGSAQRTGRNAVLQHGSILLDVTPFAPELPGIVNLTSRVIALDQLAVALAEAMASVFKLEFEKFSLDAEVQQRAREVVRERFGQQSWNEKR